MTKLNEFLRMVSLFASFSECEVGAARAVFCQIYKPNLLVVSQSSRLSPSFQHYFEPVAHTWSATWKWVCIYCCCCFKCL